MKSILKQVLTVALLLSVPAIFAGDQEVKVAQAATGRLAAMKSGVKAGYSKASTYVSESRPAKFVTAKSKAAAALASVKAGQLRNWTFNAKDSKLKTAGKVAAVAAVTGAALTLAYKTPAAIRAARNYMRSSEAKADYELAQAEKAAQKAYKAMRKASNALKAVEKSQVTKPRTEAQYVAAVAKAKEALVKATAVYTEARNLVIALTPVNQNVVKPVATPVVDTPATPVAKGPSAAERAQAQATVDDVTIRTTPQFAPQLADARAVLAA